LSFHVDIPDAERAYLDSLPLSPEAHARINLFVEQVIANVSDEFRLDPANRPYPGSPYFLVRHLIWDRWGDRRTHTVDFHVRDDGATFGVLLIVFIDHR
jgi:hypothetical protein